MHTHGFIYIYTHTHTHIYIYIYICTFIYTYNTHTHTRIYIYIYICICTFKYIYKTSEKLYFLSPCDFQSIMLLVSPPGECILAGSRKVILTLLYINPLEAVGKTWYITCLTQKLHHFLLYLLIFFNLPCLESAGQSPKSTH